MEGIGRKPAAMIQVWVLAQIQNSNSSASASHLFPLCLSFLAVEVAIELLAGSGWMAVQLFEAFSLRD